MSGAKARSGPAADPLRCVGCAKPFASKVPYCPFCGVPQQPMPRLPVPLVPNVITAPIAVAQIQEPSRLGRGLGGANQGSARESAGNGSGGEGSHATEIERVPAPHPGPLPRGEGEASVGSLAPVRTAPGKRSYWPAWLVACVLVGAIVVALLFNLGRPAQAGLVVRVHGPNGTLVQTGRILVNNRAVGAPGETLSVPPGSMTVSFTEPGWSVDPRTVSIAGHASLTVDLTARELPGHLALTTDPPGASVAFGGHTHGKTPFNADLAPGEYDISVALSGYVGKVVTLTVVHGEPATIALQLTPAPPRRVAAAFDRAVTTAATSLSAAPATAADTVAVLDPGTEVQVQAKLLSDPPWLQVHAGSQTGYVPAASVEPWQAWAQRNTISGPVDTITTDLRVVIGGDAYPLAGIQPPPGGFPGLPALDAALLDTIRNAQLRCVPRDTASFVCFTPEGRDVAQLYLLNGAAVVTDGAPQPYPDAQRAAREQRRGMWAQ